MSTRIERTFEFCAGVYFKNAFYMNQYVVSLCMQVEAESIREQNVAMERIKLLLSDYLDSSIFIQNTEKKAIDKFKDSGIKIATLPDEPYDQIIAIALLTKINSICEGRLTAEEIVLGSRLSDGVRFVFDMTEPIGPFEKTGWWNNPNTSINDLSKINKKEKIVKLVKSNDTDWNDLDLSWQAKVPLSIADKTEIIFTNDTDK